MNRWKERGISGCLSASLETMNGQMKRDQLERNIGTFIGESENDEWADEKGLIGKEYRDAYR